MYQVEAVFPAFVKAGTNSAYTVAIPAAYGAHAFNGRTISFRLMSAADDSNSYVQMMVDETLTSSINIPWKAIKIF